MLTITTFFLYRSCFKGVPDFFRRMQDRTTTNVVLLFILEALNRVVGEPPSVPASDVTSLPPSNSDTNLHEIANDEISDIDTADIFDDCIESLEVKEEAFWKTLINRYLKPIDPQNIADHHQVLNRKMQRLRRNAAFAFLFVNGLWLAVMASFQEVRHDLTFQFVINGVMVVLEPFGLFFISIFVILLVIQMVGMLIHRYSQHIQYRIGLLLTLETFVL